MKRLITFTATVFLAMSVAAVVQASTPLTPGAKVFRKCKVCHSLEAGKKMMGPSLFGLFGRKAGTLDGYKYSPAMAASGIVWDDETLAAYLKSPRTVVKGTKMAFPGLKKPEDIEALLIFLNEESAE